MHMTKKIESIEQLKKYATDGCECFILLKGCLRSTKHIRYFQDDRQFEIINYIDGSEQTLDEKYILDKNYTNIGYAIVVCPNSFGVNIGNLRSLCCRFIL